MCTAEHVAESTVYAFGAEVVIHETPRLIASPVVSPCGDVGVGGGGEVGWMGTGVLPVEPGGCDGGLLTDAPQFFSYHARSSVLRYGVPRIALQSVLSSPSVSVGSGNGVWVGSAVGISGTPIVIAVGVALLFPDRASVGRACADAAVLLPPPPPPVASATTPITATITATPQAPAKNVRSQPPAVKRCQWSCKRRARALQAPSGGRCSRSIPSSLRRSRRKLPFSIGSYLSIGRTAQPVRGPSRY